MADRPVDLGRALNFACAVTGRAMRRADRFRLHVDLLDCGDGRLIWSDTFDMAAPDVTRASPCLRPRTRPCAPPHLNNHGTRAYVHA